MTLMRILLAFAVALFAALSIETLHKRETALPQTLTDFREGKDIRRQSFFKDFYLWLIVVFSLIMLLAERTRAQYTRLLWAVVSEYLLILSLYCLVLLAFMPLLRRVISPRACGRLWELPAVMTAVVFYLEMLQNTEFVRLPRLVLYVPGKILTAFTAVWLFGFTVCLLWHVFGHIRFKKQLMSNAREAKPEIQNIWRSVITTIGLNWNIPLYVTPEIHTPLVVGVRKRAMVAFLPDRTYTRDELLMIFHHELRHVFRRDGEIKLTWVIIRSLLWFNPLAWLADRRAAEDLELSCDEFVLTGADDDVRRRYAELLLDTAGDSRGFSTCLSASARTLRYRLKCVVKPGKRLKGALALGLAAFILMMSFGTVSFAHDRGRLSDFYDFSRYTTITDSFSRQIHRSIYYTYNIGPLSSGDLSYFGKRDDTVLLDYFSNLEVLALTKPIDTLKGYYIWGDYFEDGQWAGFQLYDPQSETVLWIQLWKDWLVVSRGREVQYYKVPGGIDWDSLNTMLGPAEG